MSNKSKGTGLYGWNYTGAQRPDFAVEPQTGEESVWDYPRPPAIVDDYRTVRVLALDGTLLAETSTSKRVLETASPPTFYLPPEALQTDLEPVDGSSFCEWKGEAKYFAYADRRLAWCCYKPTQAFAGMSAWMSYCKAQCQCYVAGQRVRAQAGGFYGGWITDEIVGPYKGEPGRSGW